MGGEPDAQCRPSNNHQPLLLRALHRPLAERQLVLRQIAPHRYKRLAACRGTNTANAGCLRRPSMRVIPGCSVAAVLLLAGCASTATDTSLVTNSAPTTASPANTSQENPSPAITGPQDLSAVRERLKAIQKTHIECVLKAAQGLAFQPENPAHIAMAATQGCVRTERALQDVALQIHGTRGAYEYMRVARSMLQETAIGLVVRARAAAKRSPVSKPTPAPARGDNI
jgi:hypothetical protein